MSNKILFVDDEPAVLEGYRRTLHKDFQPDTATSGQQALDLILSDGPYAVVISDMRMPGMDGVKFLSRVHDLAPLTVRVILTGYADLQSAIDAVNEGQIFRFLTKPCEADVLRKTLAGCREQYRLITAETELLENTLLGSIKVLTDVLSLANPAAFGRAVRIRRYVLQLAEKLKLDSPWRYEMAALLSQLGCITLAPDVIEKAYSGRQLSPDQQAAYDAHPSITHDLLSRIPRLEDIAWMIGQQSSPPGPCAIEVREDLKVGAEILGLAIAFDDLKIQGIGDSEAHSRLQYRVRNHSRMAQSVASLRPDAGNMELQAVRISDLATGMVLQEDIRTNSGILIVVRGQEITYPLIVCLHNFHRENAIPNKVLALCPMYSAHDLVQKQSLHDSTHSHTAFRA